MEDAPPEQKTYATKFDKYRAGNADLAQRMQVRIIHFTGPESLT